MVNAGEHIQKIHKIESFYAECDKVFMSDRNLENL